MDKMKIIELAVLAATALLAAIRYIIKFIGYLTQLNKKKQAAMCAT